MKTTERLVHFYELQLRTNSLNSKIENPFPTNMSNMLNILAGHMRKGYEINASKSTEVTDYSFDSPTSTFILLLNRPDPGLSDVTYRDRRTNVRRHGDKSDSEAIEKSAHVIVTAHPSEPVAQVRMTMGAGVYMDRVVMLFNQLYDQNCKTDPNLLALQIRPHPTNLLDSSNNPVTYKVRHRFEHNAYPNAWLQDILDNGTVQGIELIDNRHEQFDANNPDDVIRKTLHIKTSSGRFGIDYIRRLAGIAINNHHLSTDQVRIEYKLANNKSTAKTFSLNDLDLRFTKSERIELDIEQNQHQSEISQEIIAKMQALA